MSNTSPENTLSGRATAAWIRFKIAVMRLRDDERGLTTLEVAVIAAGLLAVAVVLVGLITTAVGNHDASIK